MQYLIFAEHPEVFTAWCAAHKTKLNPGIDSVRPVYNYASLRNLDPASPDLKCEFTENHVRGLQPHAAEVKRWLQRHEQALAYRLRVQKSLTLQTLEAAKRRTRDPWFWKDLIFTLVVGGIVCIGGGLWIYALLGSLR